MPRQSLHSFFEKEKLEQLKEEHCPDKTWDELHEWAEKRAARIDAAAYERMLEGQTKKTGVPKAYLGASPSKPFSQQWDPSSSLGLYIWGDTGVGKTWEASGILLERAKATAASRPSLVTGTTTIRRKEVFTTLANILDECYEGRRADEIKRYVDYDLLLLDDMGKEKPSEYTLETLYRLIDGRIANERPTIITSNLSPEQLMRLFTIDGGRLTGDAILSRLSSFQIVHMLGEDRRQR